MDRFLYLIMFLIILPLTVGELLSIEKRFPNGEELDDTAFFVWIRGIVVCLGICGFFWKPLLYVENIKKYRIIACALILLCTLVVLFIKRRSILQHFHPDQQRDRKSLFLLIFLLFFGLCIVEDTTYYDDITEIMTKGIGASLYRVIALWTDMKTEKLVLYLFPLIFTLMAYGIVQALSRISGVAQKQSGYAGMMLLLFLLLPFWKPEWNTYSIFGRGYDTGTVFACVLAPLVAMWLLILAEMIRRKEISTKRMIMLGFYLIILIGFLNLLQVFQFSIAETSLSEEIIASRLKMPYTWSEAIQASRASLTVYGVGRYNFAMIPFCMIILLYLRDQKKSSVLWVSIVLVAVILLPPFTMSIMHNYGTKVYAGLLSIIPLPLICTYTYARIEELFLEKKYKRIVFLIACGVILLCCIHNFDTWRHPRVLLGMKGSD